MYVTVYKIKVQLIGKERNYLLFGGVRNFLNNFVYIHTFVRIKDMAEKRRYKVCGIRTSMKDVSDYGKRLDIGDVT